MNDYNEYCEMLAGFESLADLADYEGAKEQVAQAEAERFWSQQDCYKRGF